MRKMKTESIRRLSILFFLVRVPLDQNTTRIGLRYPTVYEFNPSSRWLMEKGLWVLADLIIIVGLVLISDYVSGVTPTGYIMYLTPFLVGVLRIVASLFNVQTILGVWHL